MTIETALYIMGLLFLPTAGALIYLVSGIKRLVHMHENPETTGFGTVGMRELIADNTRAMRDLSHYIQWLSKQMGHGEPSPRLSDK